MQRTIQISSPGKTFLLMTAFLLCAMTLTAEGRDFWWWQQEIAPPAEGQIINPDFIIKRDELERFWTQTQRDRGFTRQYWRWTNRWNVKYENTNRAFFKAMKLERELSEIPVYVPSPSGLQ